MEGFIKFESKFGWSELISLVAAIVAGIALYFSSQANSPNISITPSPVRAHIVCPTGVSGGERFVIAYIPFVITNNGGKATSLIGLKKTKDVPAIVAKIFNDKNLDNYNGWLNVIDTNLKDTSILDAPSWEVDKALLNNKAMLITESYPGSSKPPVLNTAIPSGDTAIAVVGFRSLWQSEIGQVYEYIVRLIAEFSNGQTRDLEFVVNPSVGGRGFGKCP